MFDLKKIQYIRLKYYGYNMIAHFSNIFVINSDIDAITSIDHIYYNENSRIKENSQINVAGVSARTDK